MDSRLYPQGSGSVKGKYTSGNLVLTAGATDQQIQYGVTAGADPLSDGGGLAVYFKGTYDYKEAYWDGADLFRVKGQFKVHNRGGSTTKGTTGVFAAEIKSEPTDVDATHQTLYSICNARGDFVAGGVTHALACESTVRSGQTFSSSAIFNNISATLSNAGTINGTGTHSNIYAIIGSGGTWTACGRLTNIWLDSHLAAAPSAGSFSFLHMSNNGAAQYGEAISITPARITNLFSFPGTNGFVSTTAETGGSSIKLACDYSGTTYYLNAYTG
jgi:hypothetical protein